MSNWEVTIDVVEPDSVPPPLPGWGICFNNRLRRKKKEAVTVVTAAS